MSTPTLVAVPGQPTLLLTPDAAASWDRLRRDVHARFGWTPRLTDAWRSYAEQERLFRTNYTTTYLPGRPTKPWNGRAWYLRHNMPTAATPGTSNHGDGTTVDVTGLGSIGQFNTERYLQFAAVAREHGWSNAEGWSIDEPWHWTHFAGADAHHVSNPGGSTGTVPTLPPVTPTPAPLIPLEEDDMRGLIEALYRIGVDRCVESEVDAQVIECARLGLTNRQVYDRIMNAPAEAGTVRRAYRDYQSREPSSAEITGQLSKGMSIIGLRTNIAAAPRG